MHPADGNIISSEAAIDESVSFAHFAVIHRPKARWSVEAGPFVVQVTGTTFDVRWSNTDGVLRVRLINGVVSVHGPLVTQMMM